MGTRLLLCCLVALLSCALCHAGIAGKEFATAFMQNYLGPDSNARFEIQISALHASTNVKVSVPELGFSQEKTLDAGEGASIQLPNAVEVTGSSRSKKTVVIKANQDVTVASLNHKPYTTETSVVYPVTSWGKLYYIFTPNSSVADKEFSITNHNQENYVKIIPSEEVTIQGVTYNRKIPFTLKLAPFETVQIQCSHDLTGSVVSSVHPVAVSSGHVCTSKFANCNHVYEQLIPVENWGKSFVVVPLHFQTNYDYVSIHASQDTEVVIKSKDNEQLKSLKQGKNEVIRIKPNDGGVVITADHGVQVLYLFNGVIVNKNLRYDPFLMMVLPTDRFGSSYTLNGQTGFDNMAIFLVRKDEQAGLSFDNTPLSSNVVFNNIVGTEFLWAEVPFTAGAGRHSAKHPTATFGLYSIGVSNRNGYGAPALCDQPAPLTCSNVRCSYDFECKMINGRPTCVPKPALATCWAMGDPHYKTLDGKRFNFMGTCTYIIAKNCEANSNLPQFVVETKNENRGNNRVSYVGQVTVKVYGFIITAARSENGFVRVDYSLYGLPVVLGQNKLELSQRGRSVVIKTDFGLTVQYDWNSYVLVTLTSNFASKVCGLCGNFNGNPNDDFATPSGSPAANAVEFGRSWKVPGLAADILCRDDCVGKCDNCEHNLLSTWQSASFCGLINLANGPFHLCHAVINPQIYFENCVFDMCMGDGLRYYLCQALEGYASACQDVGIEVLDWRKHTHCSPKCPDNSHYELCGTGCPPTCDNPTGPSKCLAPCVESCVCDAGYVLSGGKCIPTQRCGCHHEGRHIPPGESWWSDNTCQRQCTCNPLTNQVTCQDIGCKKGLRCQVVNGIRGCFPISYSTCAATGDPHYRTFDKKRYDFQGTCVYLLVGLCSKRPDLVSFEVLVQNEFRGRRSVSFTKQVLVKVYGLTIDISKGSGQRILVNGELTHLPVFLAGGKVTIYKTCYYAVLRTNFGLTVRFDWRSRVYVRLPSTYMEAVCGLCGNYNNKKEDDWTKKDGSLATSASDFGKSWRVGVIPGCVDGCDGPCPSCSLQQTQLYGTKDFCGILRDPQGPFRDCHAKVDPSGPFDDCVYDVCLFNGRKDILCKAISDYATDCQESGAVIYPWRSDSFCPIRCPLNSHYELCSSGCPTTCQSLSPPLGCDSLCQEGCTCDEGFILSGDLCVPFSQCGCVYNDRYYRIGEVFYPNGKCEEECKCIRDGEVVCKKFSCGPNEKCEVADGVRKCQPVGSGVCVASGDPHYTSFDRRRFDFQGTCTYILAEGCGLEGTHLQNFSVQVKNVRWRRASWRKVSVTEMVAVKVYGYTLIMKKGAVGVWVNGVLFHLPLVLDYGAVVVRRYGRHYFLKTNFGLRVNYNGVYRVRVRVPGNYRGKTCGLCGDFNGNKDDDFRLPDGTVTDKVNVFGAAWKVPIAGVVCDDGCVPGVTCPNCDPIRKGIFEGLGYCGMLKDPNGPFAVCHPVVDPTPYFIDCVFDICASEGDRQVLCNSAAAYALECSHHGVKVQSWRTPIFCPLPCPPNSHYEMCAGNCGNVCPDLLDIAQCPRICTEGCECDPGFLFNGESCIPERDCGCYDNGRSYKPEEMVFEDNCNRKCICNPIKGLICMPYSCPNGTKCLIRKGVMGCFNTDPCQDINCRVKQECKVVKGEAVCVPKFYKKCYAWGDPHYGTLDGYKYNFQGTCKYTLSKTCGDIGDLEPFSIEERNDNRGNRAVSFVREVYVKVYGHTFTIIKHHFGKVLVDNEVRNLPVELDDGRVTVTQKRRKAVLQTDFGLRVIYNWRSKLVIRICSSYYHSLCGLCGNFNGDSSDDRRNPAGVLVPNVIDWAKSWKVDDPNDTKCLDVCETNCPVCNETLRQRYLTQDYCGALTNEIFKDCIAKLNPKIFIENCAYDMCFHVNDKKMLCEALEVFVEQCLQEGVIVKNWRAKFGCPMSCQPNSHYEECASPCPLTCPFTGEKPVCAAVCTEDCVCDKGYVLSAGNCVLENECGCAYQGRYYKLGQSFWDDAGCNVLCVCDASLHMVVCRKDGCKPSERCVLEDGVRACRPRRYAVCRAHGDPHYFTFDQHRFNFQGTCIYQLAALCSKDPTLTPFEVVAQNDHRGSSIVSTTKVVWVKAYGITITISKHYPFKILVDGLFVSLPFEHNGGDLVVFISGWTAVVETAFGMRVTFDWNSMVAITLPNTYKGAVCGLCGNYNGKASDDGMMRDGTPPNSETELGESWRVGVVPGCISGCKGKRCHNCTLAELEPYRTKPYCTILKNTNGPFRDCHAVVDPAPYLEDCVFDACHLKGEHVCDVLAAYVANCQSRGVVIREWRTDIFCPHPCPKNSHYELCVMGCPATCASMIPRCHLPCREGCRCNEGHLLSGDVCVPVAECGCTYGGRYYKKWEVFYPHGQCQERCQCVENCAVECHPFKCGVNETCKVVDGVGGCHPTSWGRCKIKGDPHFCTFDDKHYNFQGNCSYILAKVCNKYKQKVVPFEVHGTNENYYKTKRTVVKTVTVMVYGYVITMNKGNILSVTVNDGVTTSEQTLPVYLHMGRIHVYYDVDHIVLKTDFYLRVTYNYRQYCVEVWVPCHYRWMMCGMCGNYNGIKRDDYMLPNGAVVKDVRVFGKSWALNWNNCKVF